MKSSETGKCIGLRPQSAHPPADSNQEAITFVRPVRTVRTVQNLVQIASLGPSPDGCEDIT